MENEMGVRVKVKQAAEEIPGLAAADAHAAELHEKYLGVRQQMRQAEDDLATAQRIGAELLTRAKAGEVVSAVEVREAEVATRTAEGTLVLLREAAPALLKQAEKAESELMSIACEPLRQQTQAATERYEAAVEACQKAAAARSAAWPDYNRLQLWSVATSGQDQLRRHAPAAVTRKHEIERLVEADRKAAAAASEGAREDARIKADARARCADQIRQSFLIQGRLLTPDELQRQLAARGHG